MIKRWVIHPFLLACYPILALYSGNVHEATPIELMGPIVVSIGLAAILYGLAYPAVRDWRKSGLIAAVGIVGIYGAGRLLDFTNFMILWVSSFWIPYYGRANPAHVFIAEMIVGLLVCCGIAKKIRDPSIPTALLNFFSMALLALPIVNILIARPPIPSEPKVKWDPRPLAQLETPASKPDIYYIILDSYARSDVMKALFDFDNRPFLERLERKGFYIARQATANYGQTRLCLSSSLNCRYLDEMVEGLDGDLTVTAAWIGRNDVVATLSPLGYKFVSFSSGFHETDHPESDVHMTPSLLPLTGFQRMLITTTLFGALIPVPTFLDRFETIHERVLYALDHLPDIADDPASTFTFSHFMCPHPPFLFGQDGEDVRDRDADKYENDPMRYDGRTSHKAVYYRGYRDQAIFITKRIEETIDRILAKSKTPPIIILQSDHGSGMNLNMFGLDNMDYSERMTILNAYYFPDGRYENLYDSISPINSFRVVLNTFFGTKLKLLEDKSFYSTWGNPFEFHDVTEKVAGKKYEPAAHSAAAGPRAQTVSASASR